MAYNKAYWHSKWKQQQTGWDIGYVSTPIKAYIDQLENKALKILIPGSGNSYEGEYLFRKGFSDVTLLDYSHLPFENLKKRCPEFPDNHLINEDFFKHRGRYDLIIEQTFFSSFKPELRKPYAEKIHELLNPGGKLAGLLFGIELHRDAPPFGGNKKEYVDLFSPLFKINKMEVAYNSIKPRLGNELFIILEKQY